MNRKEQQSEFTFELGLLLRPVLDVIERPEEFDEMTRRRIRASFLNDHTSYVKKLRVFCTNEPGHSYEVEWQDINRTLNRISQAMSAHFVADPGAMASNMNGLRAELLTKISMVPTTTDTTIYEAQTPFQTFSKIRDLFATCGQRVVVTDRYVDATLFSRYLQVIPDHVETTFVTWPRAQHHDSRKYDEFIEISRLFAQERGTDHYRLLVKRDFHDRLLRFDEQLYHVGGSLKDAASTCGFTLSRVDATPENLQKLDDIVSSAQELFGPVTPDHP